MQADTQYDKLYYIKIPKGQGGRAEMVRMTYVLAGKSWTDVVLPIVEARSSLGDKNPFKQFPFVETPSGEVIYQALAIMQHAAAGTRVWPSDAKELTLALSVAMGAYDLYQAFGGFSPSDAVAKKKFEEKRAPQYFSALDAIYTKRDFAAGQVPTFADCIAYEAVHWCVRRNEVCQQLLESMPGLKAFRARFEGISEIAVFRQRQAAARQVDDSV